MFFSCKNPNIFTIDQKCSSYELPEKFKTLVVSDLDKYLALFNGVKDEKAIGEFSANYLYSPLAAQRISQYISKAKLIIGLRNPFDAAYSHFLYNKRLGHAITRNKDFTDIIKEEDLWSGNPWKEPYYVRIRFYDIQIERVFKVFPKDQFICFLFEDLDNPLSLMKNIYRFLNVDEAFVPDTSKSYNVGDQAVGNPILLSLINSMPKAYRGKLHYFLPSPIFKWYMQKRIGVGKESPVASKCPQEAKEFLYPVFKPHILHLQDLIDRDLSSWLD